MITIITINIIIIITIFDIQTCAADASRVSACVQKRKDQPARAK